MYDMKWESTPRLCQLHNQLYIVLNYLTGVSTMSRIRVSTLDFKKRARAIHGSKYNYSLVNMENRVNKKVTIVCKKHGAFLQSFRSHLEGNGCHKCANSRRTGRPTPFTNEMYIERVKAVHGDTYDYSKLNYVRGKKVIIICKIHGEFTQRYSSHLNGFGCFQCSKGPKSMLAITWLNKYVYSHRLKNVQHALNGGEYTIPGTRLRVDGYHARSNTIFEFHGSRWHGDPSKYKPYARPHPHNNKTTKQLYKETLDREDYIKSLGYNLVVIWESDYKQGLSFSYKL